MGTLVIYPGSWEGLSPSLVARLAWCYTEQC